MKLRKKEHNGFMMQLCRFFILCVLAIIVISSEVVSAYVIATYGGNPIDWTYQVNPMGEDYLVNENCADCNGEAVAIRNAANTWNNAGAKFTLSYGGATNIANAPGSAAADGINSINWSSNFPTGSTTLAETTYWYSIPSGDITECDCVFNANKTWSTAAVTPPGQFDVETVMLHEFGHYLSLEHSSAPAVMQPNVSSGTQRRVLTADDINGIIAIYGPSTGGLTLAQALDNTRLTFSMGGNADWFPETGTWYYGGSAAQSGVITDSQSSTLQTTVVGPGTIIFYWRVSSEPNYDYLNVYLDATRLDRISGIQAWAPKTVSVPAGIHSIKWTYSKDSSVSGGSDCGWVDKVVYSRGTAAGTLMLLLQ
jgi:hypothetical protein